MHNVFFSSNIDQSIMQFLALLRSTKAYFAKLNLFETIDTISNPQHLRTAIIATRFYILLMTIAVLLLVLFTTLAQQTQTFTIHNPSQNLFLQLYSKYSSTLQCPCAQLEIPYDVFINISYIFHPVCSSVFVSNTWINLLFRPDMTYFYPQDFRSSASGQFQLLASLCSFINRTIADTIDDFLSTPLLSPQTFSLSSLEAQSDARNQFLKTSVTYTFRRLLNLVRGTTQMNGLQPAMQTSKIHLMHVYPNKSLNAKPFETIWSNNGEKDCFCGVTANCYASSGFFDLFQQETGGLFIKYNSIINITGFQVSCYALDALLSSSLQCFFDSDCFSTLLTYFPLTNITNLDILHINQTHYPPNTTIQTLVNNLFIEQWLSNTSFTSYYSKCAPILCTYKLTKYNSVIQVLTTLLGVYGGLSVVLRFSIPFIVRFWRNRRIPRQRQPDIGNISVMKNKYTFFFFLFSYHSLRTAQRCTSILQDSTAPVKSIQNSKHSY